MNELQLAVLSGDKDRLFRAITDVADIAEKPIGVVADNGDAAVTLTVGTSEETQRWNTPLTAARAVTLSTTGAHEGARFRIVRTAAATGAFTLDVGTGPLRALAAGQWCDVEYTGTAWVLTAAGAF